MIKRLLCTLLILLTHFYCWAVPADPTPRKIQQPDGTFVTLSMYGDKRNHGPGGPPVRGANKKKVDASSTTKRGSQSRTSFCCGR